MKKRIMNMMKNLLLIFVLGITISALCVCVRADEEEDDWDYTLKNGTLTITGTGAMEWAYSSKFSQYEINKIVVSEGITEIGMDSFTGCSKVTDVELPESLVKIDSGAFSNCIALTNIKIPDSVKCIESNAFKNCTALKEVYMGDGMTALRHDDGEDLCLSENCYPFYGCSALETISVPAGCSYLFRNKGFFTTSNGNPAVLKKLIFRGTKAQLSNALKNPFSSPMLVYLFADEIECTDGSISDTDPIVSTTAYTLYRNKTFEFSYKTMNLDNYTFDPLYSIIEQLTITYDVKSFSDNQFSRFTNLKRIVYTGAQEDWDAIDKGDGNTIPKGCTLTVHKHTDYAYTEVKHAATCTEKGYSLKQCGYCGREYGSKYNLIAALGHNESITEGGYKSTCIKHGLAYYKCERCGEIRSEELPLDPENHNSYTATYVTATCMQAGGQLIECHSCGAETFKETEPKLDHTWVQNGTYRDGTARYVCTSCGNSQFSLETKHDQILVSTYKNSPKFYYQNKGEDLYVEYSTNGGETWLPWYNGENSEISGTDKLTLAYGAGITYMFRCCNVKYYTTESYSFECTDYSQWSDPYTIVIPKTLPKITSITNISGAQTITWSKASSIKNASSVKYYLVENQCTGSWTYSATFTSSPYTYKSHQVNGKKHTYKIGCAYKDANGKTIYVLTGKTFSYYYLTRPAFSYCKNTAAGKIKLTWKRNTSASGYQVKYVCGTTTKTYTITGSKNVTKTLTGLKKGKTYKLYVRSYKTVSSKKYYSAWSSYKSVKVTK